MKNFINSPMAYCVNSDPSTAEALPLFFLSNCQILKPVVFSDQITANNKG